MKKSKKAAAVLLLLAMALQGCQQTPQEPIVAGKNSNAMIEKAGAETSGTLAERVEAPARYSGAFSDTGGKLHVTIDAAVTVPEAEQAPIVRVTPMNITQDQVDTLMDELVRGELYEFDPPKTKAELEEKILELKQKLAEGPSDEEANAIYIMEDGPSPWEEYMQARLDSLQEEYQTAPETVELQPATGKLEKTGDDGMMRAGGENTTEALGWESLNVFAGEGLEYTSGAQYVRSAVKTGYLFDYQRPETFFYEFYDGVDPESLPDVTLTAGEAQAMCDRVVEALGIPNMAFYDAVKKYGGGAQAPRCCWELQYTRRLGGVPVAYSDIDVTVTVDLNTLQEGYFVQPPWRNEKLNFYVTDDGIVGMNWESPYALGETVTEDAALMSFEDIMDIFQKMFVVKYDGQALDVTVDSIRLSYMRVAEQDKTYTGLLVPVWDFYGAATWYQENGESGTTCDPERSLFTINAVDGTVIDRGVGY